MIEIRLPKPGPEIENATITTWECAQGEKIEAGDILAIIKTPIGSFKVAAEEQGILEEILQEEGGIINFDEPIAILKPELTISDFPKGGMVDESTMPLPMNIADEKGATQDEESIKESEASEEQSKEEPVEEDNDEKLDNTDNIAFEEDLDEEEPVKLKLADSTDNIIEEESAPEETEPIIEEIKTEPEPSLRLADDNESDSEEEIKEHQEDESGESEEVTPNNDEIVKPEISPAAQKIAEQAGLDLSIVTGTGDNGKILYIDVENKILELAKKSKEAFIDSEFESDENQILEDPLDEQHLSEEVEELIKEKLIVEPDKATITEITNTEEAPKKIEQEDQIDTQEIILETEENSSQQEDEKDEPANIESHPVDKPTCTEQPKQEAVAESKEQAVGSMLSGKPFPDFDEISVQFHLAKKDDLIIPFNTVKKSFSKTQTESLKTVPHFHLFADVDFTTAEKWHQDYKERHHKQISVTDILVKACGHALALMPEMNACVRPDRIILKRSINIGVTTSVEEGVVTPVVPDVYHKSLQKVSDVIKKNTELAENSKVVLDYDTTFTITDLGAYGVKKFIPTVTAPQTSTLGVGKVTRQVVPIDDFFGIRSIMELTLSCDHRAIDGTTAARFMELIRNDLESFIIGEDPDWIKGNEQLRLI